MPSSLEKVYLRFLEHSPVNTTLVGSGLRQSQELGASHVRLVGNYLADIEVLEQLMLIVSEIGMTMSIDVPLGKVTNWTLELLRQYAEHPEIGIDFTPPQGPSQNPLFKGLLANVYATDDNTALIPNAITKALVTIGFRRVKLLAYAYRIGDLRKYFALAQQVQHLHSIFGDALYSLYPIWLLPIGNMRLTRRVCNYQRTVSILTDGTVYVCNARIRVDEARPSLSDASLKRIMETSSRLRAFYSMLPTDLTGICAICIFRDYCGNVCPSMVYNQTGAFNNSFPDCQYVYEQGRFPSEFIATKPGTS